MSSRHVDPERRRRSPARPRRAMRSDASTMYSLGRMGAAAARSEAVDRDADHRGHVARVARPAAVDADDRAPEPGAGASQQRRGLRARIHPRPAAQQLALQPHAVDRGGQAVEHVVERRRSSARRSQSSSPSAGTTLNASPQRTTVGTAVRCSGPCGSWRAATDCAALASASSALAPLSGAEPECAARPWASTRSVPAALRRTTTASSPPARQLAALEAQAGVVAGEALRVAEVARAPLLVADEQQRGLREVARCAAQARAGRRARARRRPSCRPCPSRRGARRRARAPGGPRASGPCRHGRAAGCGRSRCRASVRIRSSA